MASASAGGLNLDPQKMESSPIYQAEAIIAQNMLKQHGLIGEMEMTNAQNRINETNANNKEMNKLDMKQKLHELKEKGKELLERIKNSKLFQKAEMVKDKVIGGAKRVIEVVGTGIKAAGDALNALPPPFNIAAKIALGAAGVAGLIALISKVTKGAQEGKAEGGDGGSILDKAKKNNGTKKAEKEQKKAEKKNDKKQKLKEKVKSIITSPEFPKMPKAKQIMYKALAKKLGISVDSTTTAASAAINKLKAMNPLGAATSAGEGPQIGQEKDGMIWTGNKWKPKALLVVGERIGKSVWNGERLVNAAKENENTEKESWWQKMMSTGLTGSELDFKSTKPNSLKNKLADFIKTKFADVAATTKAREEASKNNSSSNSATSTTGSDPTSGNVVGNPAGSTSGGNPSEGANNPPIAKGSSPLNLINGFPYFKQNDSKWGNIMFSSRGDKSQTIGSSGCGPASMAMILRSYGEDVTPVDTSTYALDKGHRTANSGTAWAYFPDIGKHYGLQVDNIGKNMDTAMSYLDKGYPIISSGKGSAPFTTGGHYVVFAGKDSNGNILVNDSVSQERSKKYSINTLKGMIKNMWAFSKDGKGSIGNIQNTAGTPSASSLKGIDKNSNIIQTAFDVESGSPTPLTAAAPKSSLTNTSNPVTATPSSNTATPAPTTTATSTGYDNVSSSATSSAVVSNSSNNYTEILTKLTTISTILTSIASDSNRTANNIEDLLETAISSDEKLTAIGMSTPESKPAETPKQSAETTNNFFTPTSNYLNANGRNLHSLYGKFLKPSTIEIARGN